MRVTSLSIKLLFGILVVASSPRADAASFGKAKVRAPDKTPMVFKWRPMIGKFRRVTAVDPSGPKPDRYKCTTKERHMNIGTDSDRAAKAYSWKGLSRVSVRYLGTFSHTGFLPQRKATITSDKKSTIVETKWMKAVYPNKNYRVEHEKKTAEFTGWFRQLRAVLYANSFLRNAPPTPYVK